MPCTPILGEVTSRMTSALAESSRPFADVETIADVLLRNPGALVLTGAGISTESGIPDFRSGDGVFAAMRDYGYPPETLLSRSFFLKHTDVFFEYYRKFLLHPDAQPNDCHRALAKLDLSLLVAKNE